MATLSRRNFLGAAALGAAATFLGHRAEAQAKPNIVIIFTDDQGYNDLSCYGSTTIKTPHIDRIATEGMRFTDFYVAAPVCTPSRAALLTGCYPQRNSMARMLRGHGDNERMSLVLFPDSDGIGLNPDEITLAEVLRDVGYKTGCVGKWHLGHSEPFLPTNHGFDSYFGIPYSNDMQPAPILRDTEVFIEEADQDILTEQCTEEAVKFIKENAEHPFFLYMPHSMPHTPLHVSEKFMGKSDGGLYGDVIEMIDWSVGEVLKALEETNTADNTLVIFTSDNGPWLVKGSHGGSALPLRSGKGSCFEGGMREPCVMRWPNVIPPGSVCTEMATTMDLMPTIAKLAGSAAPTDRIIDGKDIGPLLRAEPDARTPHEAFFYYKGENLEAVRSGDWKLMFARTRGEEYPYNGFPRDAEGKVTIDRKERVPDALYNVREDVGETTDRIKDYPGIADRLRGMADVMRADLGDGRTGVQGKNIRPVGNTRTVEASTEDAS